MAVIEKEISGNVEWITINRPEVLNALNMETIDALMQALREAGSNEVVRAIVITGAGPKAFCVGLDISILKGISPLGARDLSMKAHELTGLITEIRKPVIAAVNGYAFGGGFEILLSCDLALAVEEAKFSLPEVKVSMVPGGGGTQRLQRLVGLRKAKELILTGDSIDAAEAQRLGIVNRVLPRDKLRDGANELAVKIATYSPVVVSLLKDAMNKGSEMDLRSALDYESELNGVCVSTEDHREGIQAFLEKRKPSFKGK